MNSVQQTYTPPRFLALCLGGIIFAIYQLWWRQTLITQSSYDGPVPLPLAVICAFVLGYGFAMLWWLIRATKGQVWQTFRPTRGRIIGAICLVLVTPIAVLSYLPWIVGGLFPLIVMEAPIWTIAVFAGACSALYPLSAMIVRHTYERRLLRFGLFALSFWAAYAGHLLYSGALVFRI